MVLLRKILPPILIAYGIGKLFVHYPGGTKLLFLIAIFLWVLYPLVYQPSSSSKQFAEASYAAVSPNTQSVNKDQDEDKSYRVDSSSEKYGVNNNTIQNDYVKLTSQKISCIIIKKPTENETKDEGKKSEITQNLTVNTLSQKDKKINDEYKWRCACEQGILPPGLLSSFSGIESVLRLGSGQCYHKA